TTITMSNEIHEYFSRTSSEWNKIDFLEECNEEQFQRKIDKYLRSLDTIMALEQGKQTKDKSRDTGIGVTGTRSVFVIQGRSPSHKTTTGAQMTRSDDRPDYKEARRWEDERKQVKAGSIFCFHNPTFTENSVVGDSGIINDVKFRSQEGDQEVSPSSPPQDVQDNYMKYPENFDKLVGNVDLSYIGGEEEPAPPPPKSGISEGKTWDICMIDGIDIAKYFSSLRKSLPKASPESTIWGVLDLTGQHKPTKKMFSTKWNELINEFRLDIGWKMVNLDQSEYDFFDNMEDLKAQQALPILSARLTILKSYIEHLKLPINEGELMICFVASAFRMSLDPNKKSFKNSVASQERRRQEKDPNDERARSGQKTDIIIVLPSGPALEGFIVKHDKQSNEDLSWSINNRLYESRCIWMPSLQMNLYAMDVRTSGIYRFGMIDKVSLPASSKELPAYEAVHTMLRSLEHRLNKLTDYCTDPKIKHANQL
ncbi:16589_t:CDS:10, partial [Funneliformis geosporum]